MGFIPCLAPTSTSFSEHGRSETIEVIDEWMDALSYPKDPGSLFIPSSGHGPENVDHKEVFRNA